MSNKDSQQWSRLSLHSSHKSLYKSDQHHQRIDQAQFSLDTQRGKSTKSIHSPVSSSSRYRHLLKNAMDNINPHHDTSREIRGYGRPTRRSGRRTYPAFSPSRAGWWRLGTFYTWSFRPGPAVRASLGLRCLDVGDSGFIPRSTGVGRFCIVNNFRLLRCAILELAGRMEQLQVAIQLMWVEDDEDDESDDSWIDRDWS